MASNFFQKKGCNFILTVILTVVTVSLLGVYLVRGLVERHEMQVYAQLEAVAALKSNQIKHWLDEQRFKVEMMRVSPLVNKKLANFMQGDSTKDRQFIIDRLRDIKTFYDFQATYIVDRSGRFVIGTEEKVGQEIKVNFNQSLDKIFTTEQVMFTEFYHRNDDQIYFNIIMPFEGRSNLALVLEMNQQEFIIPSLQDWPIPSDTAETVLFQHDGSDVIILNELRHEKNTAFTKRIPLSKQAAGVVQVINKIIFNNKIIEKVDSRGGLF